MTAVLPDMINDRTEPPHDIAAEQVAIGAVLAAPNPARAHELLGQIVAIAPPAVFYRPAHALLLETLTELADHNQPLDARTVNAHMIKHGTSVQAGGAPYLHTLTDAVPTVAQGPYFAKVVADKAVLRLLVQIGTRIAQLGWQGEGDIDTLVEYARDLVSSITNTGAAHDPNVTTLEEGLPAFMDRLESGAPTSDTVPVPYLDLAEKFNGGGFAPGNLVTLGARPGHGKTTIALDVMRCAAKAGKRVLFHSLEMGRDELDIKLAAAETNIATTELTPGKEGAKLSESQWERLRDYMGRASSMDIVIDEKPDCSLARVKARVNALERAGALPDLVVVDYVQLMETEEAERRDLRIAALTRGLKILAKEKGLVVLLLAQVRRESVDRTDGVPRPSDFAESSALEKDANICLMVATPHVDDLEHERSGETIVFVAKNRGGPVGEVGLSCQFQYSRCGNLAG